MQIIMKRFFSVLLVCLSFFAVAEAQDGFSTEGTRLIDANGNEFIMRGANYSWCWQKGKEYSVIPAAKRIGCNTLRIQLGTGRRFSKPDLQELKTLISLCEENKLVVVFNTHDATGSDNYSDLEEAAKFWIPFTDILNEHTHTTIVNIANEWMGAMYRANEWAEGYKKAIAIVRDAGIRNTLMIDAAGWGQWPESIFEKAGEVAAADRLHNIVFSMHFYDVAAKDAYTVRQNIDRAIQTGFPVVIGEFACSHGGKYVDWQTILDYSASKKMGWLVWSWTGNSGGVEDCDMFGSYDDSSYRPNGTNTVLGRNGIKETARECSIFGSFVATDKSDLWNGSSATGNWANDVLIDASKFADAKAGDVLSVYLKVDAGKNYGQIELDDYNYKILEADRTADALDGDGCVQPYVTQLDYTLTPSDVALLKANGLRVKGKDITINRVTLTSKEDTTTGISDVMTDDNAPVEYYNLNGMRVNDPAPGIYIRRQGNKVSKIIVR